VYSYIAVSVIFDPLGQDGRRHIVVHGPYETHQQAQTEHDALLGRLHRTYAACYVQIMPVTEVDTVLDTLQDLAKDIARVHRVTVN
jgi:hypothetical protein